MLAPIAKTSNRVNPRSENFNIAVWNVPAGWEVGPDPRGNGIPLLTRADGGYVWGRNERGTPICCAPRTAVAALCGSDKVMFPSGRCRKHGGKAAKVGAANPAYKTGKTAHRYRAVLSGKAAESFDAWIDNPQLLELSGDISVARGILEGHLPDANLGRVDPVTLEDLQFLSREMTALIARTKKRVKGRPILPPAEAVEQFAELVEQFQELTSKGVNQQARELEVQRWQAHIASLTSQENARLERKVRALTPVEVFHVFMPMLETIKVQVVDPHAKLAIAAAVTRGFQDAGMKLTAPSPTGLLTPGNPQIE